MSKNSPKKKLVMSVFLSGDTEQRDRDFASLLLQARKKVSEGTVSTKGIFQYNRIKSIYGSKHRYSNKDVYVLWRIANGGYAPKATHNFETKAEWLSHPYQVKKKPKK